MKTKYFVLIIVLFVSGCTAQAPLVELEFETLAQGSNGGVPETREVVIQNSDDFKSLWAETYSNFEPVLPSPAIDFSTETVIAVFLGSKSTGGYSIEVMKAEDYETEVVVTYKITEPEPGSMVTQAFTSPFHMVKTDKITNPVRFQESQPF